MKTKFIIANWKENPQTLDQAKQLLHISDKFLEIQNGPNTEGKNFIKKFWMNFKFKIKKIFRIVKSVFHKEYNFQITHAVPSVFAGNLIKENKNIILQDVFWAESGAYTGKFGAAMAKSIGVDMSIVGHSETRESSDNLKGYTDEEINLKLKNLFHNEMWALLCVGEKDRGEMGDLNWKISLQKQLTVNLKNIERKDLGKLVIAYEPVWAIGAEAKRVATEVEIVESIEYIQEFLANLYGNKTAGNVMIVYGGSVSEENIKNILALNILDGVLVGRASSDVVKWQSFLNTIVK